MSRDDREQLALLLERCPKPGHECRGPRTIYNELTDDFNTHWHIKPGVNVVDLAAREAEAVKQALHQAAAILYAQLPDCDEHCDDYAASLLRHRADQARCDELFRYHPDDDGRYRCNRMRGHVGDHSHESDRGAS